MADKELDPEDPFEPVAVALSTPGYDGMEAMARCFVEEFAMMGWPPERIFKLFTIPDFVASNAVYVERGPAYVRALIVSVMGEEFAEPDLQAEMAFQLTPVDRRSGQRQADANEEENQHASGI